MKSQEFLGVTSQENRYPPYRYQELPDPWDLNNPTKKDIAIASDDILAAVVSSILFIITLWFVILF